MRSLAAGEISANRLLRERLNQRLWLGSRAERTEAMALLWRGVDAGFAVRVCVCVDQASICFGVAVSTEVDVSSFRNASGAMNENRKGGGSVSRDGSAPSG